MTTTYRTILTTTGLQLIADAAANATQINLTQMAVGDGAGNPVEPVEAQGILAREMYRATPNVIEVLPGATNTFVAELTIPSTIGGFTIREAGLFTDSGQLFAVANLPATYKPVDTEGAFADTVVRMIFVVSNASVVNIYADPNVVLATRSWALNNIGPAQIIPGGTTSQVLTKRTNADGDVEWRDATEVNVTVNTLREIQTAADGQDTFILSTMSTTGTAVYVEGLREFDVSVVDNVTLVLSRGLPDGTRVMFVQNDPAAPYLNRLQRPGNYFFAQI